MTSKSRFEKIAERSVFDDCPEAESLLDVGCGNGRISLAAVRRGLQVDALDIDPEIPARLSGIETLRYLSADLNSWTPTGNWDIIVLHNVIQFLSRETALKVLLPSLVSHLKPRGVIEVLTFGVREGMEVPTKYSLEEITEAVAPLTFLDAEVFTHQGITIKGEPHLFHLVWVRARKDK